MGDPQVVHEDALRRVAQYRTGPFAWTVDGDSVVITRDVGASVEPISTYEYKDFETAAEMAWRMAVRQARAASGERTAPHSGPKSPNPPHGYEPGGPGGRILIARWESRGGAHWVDLHKDSSGNFGYSTDGGGGHLGKMTQEEAMATMEGKLGYLTPDKLKTGLRRVGSVSGNPARTHWPSGQSECRERDPASYIFASIDSQGLRDEIVVMAAVLTDDFRTVDVQRTFEKLDEAHQGRDPNVIWSGYMKDWKNCRETIRFNLGLDWDSFNRLQITFVPPLNYTLEPVWKRTVGQNPHGSTRPARPSSFSSIVTQDDVDRMNKLVARMGGDVANLSPEEQAEYHALREKFERALDEDFVPSSEQTGSDSEMGENPPRITGRATRIWNDSAGNTHVRYHDTDVVSFNNEWIALRLGGWDTVTTRSRMNRAADVFGLGYHVARRRGTTYVSWGGREYIIQGTSPFSLDRGSGRVVSPDDNVSPSSEMPRRQRRGAAVRTGSESERSHPGGELGFKEGAWEETEKNPPESKADALVNDHGSVVIIMPLSGAAKDWWESNVQEAQRWGSGYAVEPRYAEAIIQGMQEAGFSVGAG